MRGAVVTSILGAVLASPVAIPAYAEDPLPEPAPAPQPAQPGRMKLEVLNGKAAKGRKYVLTGDTVTVVGHVKPYVAGQTVRVRVSTKGRTPTLIQTKISQGKREGTFRVRFRTRRAVTYSVYARHDATPEQAQFDAKSAAYSLAPNKGMAVALLKQGLRSLGYPAGRGPRLDARLGRSVLAFRKVNGMARISSADRRVYGMVFAGKGAFKLRYPRAGKHVEADLSLQVLVLADENGVVATYPTSSGAPATPTVLGRYRFYRKDPGTNAKGMYMSNYFIRGYAIHGFPEVPTYNASHGCLRVPNAEAVSIFNRIALGESIWVYR